LDLSGGGKKKRGHGVGDHSETALRKTERSRSSAKREKGARLIIIEKSKGERKVKKSLRGMNSKDPENAHAEKKL